MDDLEEPTPPITVGHEEFMGLTLPYVGTLGVPIEAVIILKVMDDGDFGYRLLSTEDLNTVEALGMTDWAHELIKDGFRMCRHEEE